MIIKDNLSKKHSESYFANKWIIKVHGLCNGTNHKIIVINE